MPGPWQGPRPGSNCVTSASPRGKETVLDSVSGTFHRGERIGIVGASGAGKTTLVSLLLRFYTPTRGAIYLDDVDLRDIRHDDRMDQTAIVLQEPVLFIDTVANNIRHRTSRGVARGGHERGACGEHSRRNHGDGARL